MCGLMSFASDNVEAEDGTVAFALIRRDVRGHPSYRFELQRPCCKSIHLVLGHLHDPVQEEMNLALPPVPVLFFKPSTTLANPSETISVPKVAQHDEMDYEVELAVVLGRDAKDVDEKDALGYVCGYTCGNDLTARGHQGTSSQWGFCKGE